MRTYYLTEMNLLKLENTILKFIHNNNIGKTLSNGIIEKLSAIMYEKQIDYYYPDHIATTLQVDIKHVDTIYLHGHNNQYNKPLSTLLQQCTLYTGKTQAADKLEKEIYQILKTRKPIHTKKIKQKWK